MSRAATSEAKNQLNTTNKVAGQNQANAQSSFNTLQPAANSLVNSTGYDPATLGAITNASMGASNAAFGTAADQIQRNAAQTHNPAGVAGQLDALAQQKGIAGGTAAGNVQIANAQEKDTQRQQGLSLLNSLYGTSLGNSTAMYGQAAPVINAQTNASPGWAQTTGQLLTAIGSVGKGCWVAAEFYGWYTPSWFAVRNWIFSTWYMTPFAAFYARFGERWASLVRRNATVRNVTRKLFAWFLRKALGH
jgi:hypothetical protein